MVQYTSGIIRGKADCRHAMLENILFQDDGLLR